MDQYYWINKERELLFLRHKEEQKFCVWEEDKYLFGRDADVQFWVP